jgi:ABC-type transport system involved in cytochrome c biogenesis ATPase subunit
MPSHNKKLRVNRISIRNFRALSKIALDLPAPSIRSESDVFVLGSRNGLGKTSVLEAIASVFLSWEFGKLDLAETYELAPFSPTVEFPEYVIRSGANHAEIVLDADVDDQNVKLTTRVGRDGRLETTTRPRVQPDIDFERRGGPRLSVVQTALSNLMGVTPEPLSLSRLLYFHSHRKVIEGNTELQALIDPDAPPRPRYRRATASTIGAVKIEILRALMGKSQLFEQRTLFDTEVPDPEASLETLNRLIMEFADGRLEKLRHASGNSIDIRISNRRGGPSFSFDGLSSGQKEIISTLFLIWVKTLKRPSIVLIDEPELHLNAEWHKKFVRKLTDLSPQNQYIVATHSEDVASAVPSRFRAILEPAAEAA